MTDRPGEAGGSRGTTSGSIIAGLSLLLLLAALLLRSPTWYVSVIDWDESIFILAGREILAGHFPYTTLFDNKPAGLWLAMAGIVALGGDAIVATRVAAALCVGVTAILLMAILRSMRASRAAAFGGGLLYVAFSVGLQGTALHTEILLAPLTTAAVLAGCLARDTDRLSRQALAIVVSGLLFGASFMIKQVVLVPAGIVMLAVLLGWWGRGRATFGGAVLLAVLGAVAFLVPIGATAAAYWGAGLFPIFWYAHFGFIARYAAQSASTGALLRNFLGVLAFLWAPIALAGLAGAAILAGLRRIARSDVAPLLMLAWAAAELFAAVAPRQFFSHHFLVLLPPLAVLAAWWLDGVVTRWVAPAGQTMAALGCAAFIAGIPAVPFLYVQPWSSVAQPDALRLAAREIRARLGPGDRLYVVNSQPALYFMAGAPLPSVLAFPPHLAGFQTHLSPIDPDAELDRVLATRPRLLVIDRTRWEEIRPAAAERIAALVDREYRPVHEFVYRGGRIEVLERK